MNKKISILILFFALAVILFIGSIRAEASVGPESAIFDINLADYNLSTGPWQLTIVPLPMYGLDSVAAQKLFDQIKNSYLTVKTICGPADYFAIRLNPTLNEIDSLKQIYPFSKSIQVSKGTYGMFDQGYLFFKNQSYYDNCYTGYGAGGYTPTFSTLIDNNYKAIINFQNYNYLETSRDNQNNLFNKTKAFYAPFCEVKNNSCQITISKFTDSVESNKAQGPFIVVLEKMMSGNEILFSDPVNINWNQAGNVQWQVFNPQTYPLSLENIKFQNLSANLVATNNQNKVPVNNKNNNWFYITPIIIVLLGILLYFLIKKNKAD